MRPDRSNYEIWIIDWLDGKLDPAATEILMAFLEANPDLKEEAESLSLSHLGIVKTIFPAKEDLKKTVSDLPKSQIEFLSVAYLENDITPGQMSDLEQSFDLNRENKREFDIIQKIRLIPPELTFKNKYLLKKQNPGVKVFRLASIALSAAASIAVLIISYVFLQRYLSQKNNETEQIIVSEYTGVPLEVRTKTFSANLQEPVGRNETVASVKRIYNQAPVPAAEDITPAITRPFAVEIHVAPVISIPEVSPGITGQFLAATNNKYIREPYDEERSRINRFIARNFREKILKEPVPSESPLKSFEIAEAGIDGLNKLLGWNMALVKTIDEQGELKSIYFSSRMLKFNAPVKKTEPLP
jgi:hypothetical protein